MKFDKYTLKARVFPSVIIIVPFLVFTLNCNIDGLKNVFDDLLKVKIIGNVSVSLALLFLFTQVNRFIGKFLFENYMFKNETEMPTTNFMLYTNSEFSREYKNKIRQQIKSDFQITLPSEKDEIDDLSYAKKRIVEAIGLVRQKVKNGRLLLQHNIEYGFMRNLIGGSIFGLIMSLVLIFYFNSTPKEIISFMGYGLGFFYFIMLIFHRSIIRYLGNQYARRLFQEYLQK